MTFDADEAPELRTARVIVVANEKGGLGKSICACPSAFSAPIISQRAISGSTPFPTITEISARERASEANQPSAFSMSPAISSGLSVGA
jgi:hypothetical protein